MDNPVPIVKLIQKLTTFIIRFSQMRKKLKLSRETCLWTAIYVLFLNQCLSIIDGLIY